MGRKFVFVNPPVQVVSQWQLLQYPEPYPYGLNKLGTLLKKQGHSVRLIDMMEYDHYDPEFIANWSGRCRVYSHKRAGSRAVTDVVRPSRLLGRDMGYLRTELARAGRPDEIWVTACLTFNWETAHEAIGVCKEVFPDVKVRFGGIYPTLLPQHARTSRADEIVEGKVEEAEREFGDVSLYEKTPTIGLFNLATGCSNRCSFCINHHWKPTLRTNPRDVLDYLLQVRKTHGITHFSNWDPNVMLFMKPLTELLDLLIEARTDLTFSFNMGIQSNKVSPAMAEKMRRAGVTQMTIPFETSDPALLRHFRKPYRLGTPMKTLRYLRDAGFELGRFHSCSLFGLDDEKVHHLFRTYFIMVLLGARPIFSPLSPVPTSEEWSRLSDDFEGKPIDELNGYLFPLLRSKEKVELYELLIEILHQTDIESAIRLGKRLPQQHERELHEELELAGAMLRDAASDRSPAEGLPSA
jgi:radical SAM superfamily enzyme YgiQ (UPF0313 family)